MARRHLRVPGRIIGKHAPMLWEYIPQTSLPYNLSIERLSAILISDDRQKEWNRLKARWEVVARDNSEETKQAYGALLNWDKGEEKDVDGRDRAGMPVKPRVLDEQETRKKLLGDLLLQVGIDARGEVYPKSRNYPYRFGFGIN